MNSDVKKVLEGFVEIGWIREDSKKHAVVRNPRDPADRVTLSNGHHVDPEYLKKLRSRLRRAANPR